MKESSHSPADQLVHILDHLAHLLPAQGPIGVFIHHNTLHAFQHLPFEQAVTTAANLFAAEPYMSEAAYREAWQSGRIRDEDLDAVLARELPHDRERARLWRLMLTPGIRAFRPETIRWEMEEGSLSGESDSVLFRFWLENASPNDEAEALVMRPRDGILARLPVDIDDEVNPLLIKLSGAYLDQGLAYWPMPRREEGFWKSALALLGKTAIAPHALRNLRDRARQWHDLDASTAVLSALAELGVPESDWEPVLRAELLALPGWAGLFRQLELDPALAPHDAVPATLLDFVAVRLLITLSAVTAILPHPGAWRTGVGASRSQNEANRLIRAAACFDAARLAGLDAKYFLTSSAEEIERFRQTVNQFGEWERRRVWHAAYERRHERQILLPIQQHAGRGIEGVQDRLAAQVFFCIDEREESIRRHLEEADPEIETFGAAGFFGVAMNYTGLDDAHGVALCPVVVKPAHLVEERPVTGHEESHSRRRTLRRAWAKFARHSFVSSRTLIRGWLGTTVLGLFSFFPLAARVLSPRRYANWVNWLNASILPEPRTELTFMRSGAEGHHAAEGLMRGFTVAEKVERVASVLGPAGVRKAMARLVVVLGHGSTSLNNPHESAHDCGACGGRRGGPNARIFAAMANHPGVRAGLRDRDILIPEDTWFIGGYHDTCNDDIDLYDLESVPATHAADLERVRASLDAARAASAHERTRRFEAASTSRRAIDGLHHVQERAEHLAEPRPEYGHCTNSVCIVGRRATTRGLFLDRRAFLVSYDATQDADNSSLARLLGAVIPVCGGISLEYYFSFIDNERYGCGTKLPHNVTGLVGVMNGYESDLRTGLPWQMVEIHEPVRILFVLETTPERALATIRANPLLWEFLSNRWIRLSTMDPADPTIIHAYRGGDEWERVEGHDELLAEASSSLNWYHGKREHLPVARIRSAA
ncbi:MAG: DUF2309 domain-containing protein [Bryobacterales bacterium]|nr:DUF2309 domain-containing protein [Bryobacterales bacterium]